VTNPLLGGCSKAIILEVNKYFYFPGFLSSKTDLQPSNRGTNLNLSTNLLSPRAIELVRRQGIEPQKFLITGASGWLGKTFFALHREKGHEFLFIGSRARDEVWGNEKLTIYEYNQELINSYRPTVIVDFGFLTHEHLRVMSQEEYKNVNEKLIDQAMHAFQMPSVRYGLFTSSGFAVHPTDASKGSFSNNPYGYLKRLTEDRTLEVSQRTGKPSIVLRPWSLSGTLTTKKHPAFTSFINQSFTNEINVEASNPVQRRYSSADDFLALATAKLFSGKSQSEIFDSGGELISLVDLADKIAQAQSHDVTVVSNIIEGRLDQYHSDNTQWLEECRNFEFTPENIEDQIYRNIAFVRDGLQGKSLSS
jgi:nucleoside-diphosphate-sugar epimerase